MSVFRHAVASFEPTASSVLLWTRLSGGATSATWTLARDPELTDVVASGTADTRPDDDATIVVEVDALEPARSYWYRFDAGGQRSPVGRTRTLPAGPVESFRIGVVCCAHYAEAPFGVYRALAEREVDLVLHVGDYIYEDDGAGGHRTVDPPHETVRLDDYRRRLAQTRADPDAQALHLRHPMVAIWDDHDVCDNAWRGGAKRHDPARHGAWSDRVDAALRARQEWLPVRDPDRGRPWRSVVVGDLAELLLLDTRLVGRDQQAGDDGAPPLDDPQRSLLGPDQRAWLDERLDDVSRPWSVVVSGVVVDELELRWPRPLRWMDRLAPSGYAILDGRVMHDDQWDGYPAERRHLVERLRRRTEAGGRSVVLSGDVHSSWAFEGPTDPATGAAVAVEFTTPAVSSAAMGRAHYPVLWRVLDHEADKLDHVAWCDVTNRGYTIVDVGADDVACEWWFVRPYDRDPSGSATLGAAYVTAAGEPTRLVRREAPSPDPTRTGLPAPLPPRPADLGPLRRRRRARLATKGAALLAAASVALGAAVARARR